MGFYDNYNFEGTKLFSRMQKEHTLCEPSKDFLFFVNQLKTTPPPPNHLTVAEIGIGYGATVLQVLKMLDEGDVYYIFDFEDRLKEFMTDLQSINYSVKCRIIPMGNSHSSGDSYNWNLSKMIFEMRERREAGIFDAVYLDGAHTFLYTGLGVCLLKELLKDNGILILDDVFWSISNQKNKAFKEAAIKAKTPQEQMDDMQILRVQKIFLTNDPNFEELSAVEPKRRSVFRKLQS